jgi:hypothetical protein
MYRIALTLIALASFASSTRADFTPIAGWDHQLFPSYIISTAALRSNPDNAVANILGDQHGVLGAEVVAPKDGARVEVTIECDEYFSESVFAGKLPKAGETYSIFPKLKYKFDALSNCKQATPTTVTFRVQIGKGDVEEQSLTMTMRSINDCPVKLQAGEEIIDTSFTFAAYVNEQHPFLDKLLRESLDIGAVKNFAGYQAKTHEDVLLQIYSIWDMLVSRDVRYSSVTTTAVDSDAILSQNVRLLEDTINNQQANCVDGSVLMVSILRKIDIESFLVLVPGHCYVGFYLDEAHTIPLGIETTLLGAGVSGTDVSDELLERAVPENLRGDVSWPSFLHAVLSGTQAFHESKTKFEDPAEADYKIINVAAARKSGVIPIPFRGNEAFLAFDHSASAVIVPEFITPDGAFYVYYDEDGAAYYYDENEEIVYYEGEVLTIADYEAANPEVAVEETEMTEEVVETTDEAVETSEEESDEEESDEEESDEEESDEEESDE